MDRVKVIPFSEYRSRRPVVRPLGLMAATPPTEPPTYTSPEDDPTCKYNGKYVIADCYCKYPDFYTQHKAEYNLTEDQLKQFNYYCWQGVTNYPADKQCNQFKSKEEVTMDCYCKYPAAYQNKFFGFSDEELSHMNAVCKKRYEEENQASAPNGFGKFVGRKLLGGVEGLWSGVSLLVTFLMTPEGIKTVMETLALLQVPKAVFKYAIQYARKGIYKLIFDVGLEKVLKSMAKYTTERALSFAAEEVVGAIGASIATVIAETLTDVMVTSTLFAAQAALLVLPGVGEVIRAIFVGIDGLMLAGMVFDLLGERFYGYNNQLAAKDLIEMSDGYNKVFMQVVMAQLNLRSITWPVEFFADSLIAQIPMDDDTQTGLLGLQLFHITEYLTSLTFNSRGEFIYHTSVNQPGQFPFNENNVQKTISDLKIKENLQGLSTSLLYLYSNDNTSVVIFLRRNWFVLTIVILVIVIFIVFIK